MEEKRGRCRRREKQPLGLRTLLRREGRRWCAAALCVSMIAGNTLSLAMAAEKSTGSFLFRLDRAALYGALQEAILEDELVDRDFAFEGEMAEEYTLLLNGSGEEEGSLYELNPVIANNDDRLNLRIFARLDGDIPLQAEDGEEQEEYEITGNEKFIFLLSNRSGREQSAVIQVDEKKTGIVIVPPGSGVSTLAEPDGKEPEEETKGEKETDQEKELEAKPSAGGSGGGGGSGSAGEGGSAGSGGSAGGSGSVEGGGNASWDNGQQGDSGSAGADLTEGEGKPGQNGDSDRENLPSPEAGTGDTKPDGGTAPEESGNVTSDNKSDNDSSHDDGSGNSTVSGGSQESGSSDTGNTDSGSDQESGDTGNGNDSGGDTGSSSADSGSSDSGDTGSSSADGGSSDSGDTGSSSADSGSTGSGDTGSSSADSGSTDSGDTGSASSGDSSDSLVSISCRKAVLVASSLSKEAASPSDADEKEEASPSDAVKEENLSDGNEAKEEASPSDAEEEILEGQWYEAVYLRESGVVAFVTTAMDLGLDEEDFRESSSADALPARMYTAEKTVGRVTVEVIAEEGVIPEEAELQVTELTKDGNAEEADKYAKAEQALEEAGTEYTGMMAVDISFWLDGEEIEPDGPVQVSMRVDSEQLPKEADLGSLEIHHLVGTDEIEAVEIVADSGDKAEGFIEVNEAEALAAEFEVESFSTFTITWGVKDPYSNNAAQIRINATCYDESGQLLEADNKEIEIPYFQGTTEASMDLSENSQISQMGLYDFVKASTLLNGEKIEFTKCKIWVEWNREANHIVYVDIYYYNGDNQVGYNRSWDKSYGGGADYSGNIIRLDMSFVYHRDDSQIRITDSIKNNGFLKAELSPELLSENDGKVIYKWFKNTKEDFETAEEVTEKLVTRNDYNLSADGSSVNVALDMGAEHYYWVEVYEKEDGDKTGGLIGRSAAYYVGYSDELKNGGFENPLTHPQGSSQVSAGTEGLEWKTTENQQTVEIVGKESSDHNIYRQGGGVLDPGVPEGEQCGEINSKEDGALYQDVLTIPGSTLYWQLYHRARGHSGTEINIETTDTMYVVIMATQDAERLFQAGTGEDLTERIRSSIGDSDFPGSVWTLTDNGRQWWFHNDAYTVREGQYLTRFFFISGDTANGDKSQGNLLDDITFSTELKPPSKEKGHLSVTKVVEGLTEDEINNYEIKLSIKNEKGEAIDNTGIKHFVKTSDTTYSGTCVISNLDIGDYQISEEVVTSGELANSLTEKYTAETPKVKKDGETEFSELKIGESVETSIVARGTSSIQIVNAYKDKVIPKTLTIGKEVKNGKKDEEFKFQYKVFNGDNEISESEYENIKVYEGDKEDNSAIEHQFTLKGGQEKRMEGIPSGYRVVVTELEAGDYETLITHKKGSPIKPGENSSISPNNRAAIVGKSFELDITEDTDVLFTNSKKTVTPTGVHTNSIPHLLLLAMAALGMAGMAATGTTAKVHKKEEE